MTGPVNAVMGDETNFGTELPQTQTPDTDLAELQKVAKFSRTAEFKALKTHLENRIAFYQTFLPGGLPLDAIEPERLGHFWLAADKIINELRAVINTYESAAEAIKEAKNGNPQ